MDNIILIGFMGCGKTSVGKQLAQKLNFTFYDSDQMIEQESERSIPDIFATEGEIYFRKLETATIDNLYGKLKHSVLSVGGGLPMTVGNPEKLKRLGHVVYLKTSKETLLKRLTGDKTRPLLSGDDLEKKIDKLLKMRAPTYEAVASDTVVTDAMSFEAIIDDIITKCCKESN